MFAYSVACEYVTAAGGKWNISRGWEPEYISPVFPVADVFCWNVPEVPRIVTFEIYTIFVHTDWFVDFVVLCEKRRKYLVILDFIEFLRCDELENIAFRPEKYFRKIVIVLYQIIELVVVGIPEIVSWDSALDPRIRPIVKNVTIRIVSNPRKVMIPVVRDDIEH